MALARCDFEECQGLLVISFAATAVDEHLAKQNLGVQHSRACSAADPLTAFSGVCGHAATFDQHAPVPVLGARNAFGRPAKPLGSFLVIALNADAFRETDPEVEGRDEISGLGGALEPMTRFNLILRLAALAQHEIRKVGLGGGITEFSCTLEPEGCAARIAT